MASDRAFISSISTFREYRKELFMIRLLYATRTACVLAVLLVFALPAFAEEHRHENSVSANAFGKAMHAGMDTMMRDMEGASMTGDPDQDFLAMMIPHHEGAVEMARLVLIHGRDPLVRQLAEEIIASQTAEIGAMRKRLAVLRIKPDPEPGGFPALRGTRGPAKTE
jgi:hypothetical protein